MADDDLSLPDDLIELDGDSIPPRAAPVARASSRTGGNAAPADKPSTSRTSSRSKQHGSPNLRPRGFPPSPTHQSAQLQRNSRPLTRESKPNSRPESSLKSHDEADESYESEFELPDEQEETDEERDEEDGDDDEILSEVDEEKDTAVDSTASAEAEASTALVESRPKKAIAQTQLYTLKSGKRGYAPLRSDLASYNTSLLGGVPPSWRMTQPLGVVFCERAVDARSKQALEQSTRLANLKEQDERRRQRETDALLRATLHSQALSLLDEKRKVEKAKLKETQLEVKAAVKEFELKLSLKRKEDLVAKAGAAQADREARDASQAKKRAVRERTAAEKLQSRLKQQRAIKLQKMQADLKEQEQRRRMLEGESKEEDKQAITDATVSDEDAADADGSPKRKKRPAAEEPPSPFKPPSPLHSSRAIPVDSHSSPLTERLTLAKVEWKDQEKADVIVPRRDAKAAKERKAQLERELKAMQEREALRIKREKAAQKRIVGKEKVVIDPEKKKQSEESKSTSEKKSTVKSKAARTAATDSKKAAPNTARGAAVTKKPSSDEKKTTLNSAPNGSPGTASTIVPLLPLEKASAKKPSETLLSGKSYGSDSFEQMD